MSFIPEKEQLLGPSGQSSRLIWQYIALGFAKAGIKERGVGPMNTVLGLLFSLCCGWAIVSCASSRDVSFSPVLKWYQPNPINLIPDSLKTGEPLSICGNSGKLSISRVDSTTGSGGSPAWDWQAYFSCADTSLEIVVSGKNQRQMDCRLMESFDSSVARSTTKLRVDSLVGLMKANQFMKEELGSDSVDCKVLSRGKVCFVHLKKGGIGPIVAESSDGKTSVLSGTCTNSVLILHVNGSEYLYARENGCGLGISTSRVIAYQGGRWVEKMHYDFE